MPATPVAPVAPVASARPAAPNKALVTVSVLLWGLACPTPLVRAAHLMTL
ncbi:hypothetical protein [Streptomyces virginiae]|uniref:EamA family transporter n=1 Tax=Streptomyces virginiae TaxID=1961 RepID=A0ABZ1T3W2_STRVG|nr:hypothetical protein [Streptomyces virginiae]